VLLKTIVERELGLAVDNDANPLRDAGVMGCSFGLAALAPIAPYVFLLVSGAVYVLSQLGPQRPRDLCAGRTCGRR